MDRNSDRLRQKAIAFLETQTTEEISYILGRYCGPSNNILCEKKFGYILPKDVVENYLNTRIMEESLFGTDS